MSKFVRFEAKPKPTFYFDNLAHHEVETEVIEFAVNDEGHVKVRTPLHEAKRIGKFGFIARPGVDEAYSIIRGIYALKTGGHKREAYRVEEGAQYPSSLGHQKSDALHAQAIIADEQSHPCRCETRDLMIRGCNCGGT